MPSPKHMLIVDPQMAGIAGDMFVAALLDLGAEEEPVISAMESVSRYMPGCTCVKVKPKPVLRSHIGGLHLEVEIEETSQPRPGRVLLEAVKRATEELGLSEAASSYAQRAVRILVEAEASVHRRPPEEVHLHAAGSADTAADVVGCAVALDQLGMADPSTIQYYALPVAVGGGAFQSGHGRLVSPGPAVTRILTQAGLTLVGGPVDVELTTPTGAALLAALNPLPTQVYPPVFPEAVGYGAGSADLPGVPNLLRLVAGRLPSELSSLLRDQVVVLETNVDDVPGETLGYLVERLMEEGAKDVTIIPTVAKKNRPGHLISVIAAPEDEVRLTRIIIEETGSLGVRASLCNRHLLARELRPIKVKLGGREMEVRVKVSTDRDGNILQVKPEYEDVRRLAIATGQSLIEVARRAEAAARQVLGKGEGREICRGRK